jgi:HipA-like protein
MKKKTSERLKMRFKTPPPTLFVLLDSIAIAELKQVKSKYLFSYLPAFAQFGLASFPGLPFTNEAQEFADLPAFFAERLPDLRRPEIRDWMKQHGVAEEDKLQLLASLGAHAVTDPFELRLQRVA